MVVYESPGSSYIKQEPRTTSGPFHLPQTGEKGNPTEGLNREHWRRNGHPTVSGLNCPVAARQCLRRKQTPPKRVDFHETSSCGHLFLVLEIEDNPPDNGGEQGHPLEVDEMEEPSWTPSRRLLHSAVPTDMGFFGVILPLHP